MKMTNKKGNRDIWQNFKPKDQQINPKIIFYKSIKYEYFSRYFKRIVSNFYALLFLVSKGKINHKFSQIF